MDHDSISMDFGAMWRSQPIDDMPLSLEEILRRAKKSEVRMRRGAILFGTAAALHALANIVRHFIEQNELRGWIGGVEFTTLVILLVYWPLQYARHSRSPLHVVPRPGSIPGLDFYRRQLEARRSFITDKGARARLIILVLLFLLHALRDPVMMLPLGVPFIVAAIVFYRRKRRELPLIQRDLDDLKAFVTDNYT